MPFSKKILADKLLGFALMGHFYRSLFSQTLFFSNLAAIVRLKKAKFKEGRENKYPALKCPTLNSISVETFF